MDAKDAKNFILEELPDVIEQLVIQAKSGKAGSVYAARLLFEVAGILEERRPGRKRARESPRPIDEAIHPPPDERDIDNELVEFEEIAKRIR
jgi:hypothetical protein